MIFPHEATAEHAFGKVWLVTVSDPPAGYMVQGTGRTWEGAVSAARVRLAELHRAAPEDVDLTVRPVDPQDRELADAYRAAVDAAAEANRAQVRALDAAVLGLTRRYTIRDAGAILGLSHQYVGKIKQALTEGEQ